MKNKIISFILWISIGFLAIFWFTFLTKSNQNNSTQVQAKNNFSRQNNSNVKI